MTHLKEGIVHALSLEKKKESVPEISALKTGKIYIQFLNVKTPPFPHFTKILSGLHCPGGAFSFGNKLTFLTS